MPEIKQKTFFGRRRGKGMSKAKSALVESRMGEFAVKLPKSGKIDFSSLFDFEPSRISLEIGYGDGEHLIAMAKKNPGEAFVGSEAYVNGNAAMLRLIIENNLRNVRIFPDDVTLLLPHIGEGAFDRLYILYPDPWPKSRHEARRMVRPGMLPAFHSILSAGGEMLVVSDHPAYIPWVLLSMQNQEYFSWSARRSADFARPPADWETTRYEEKALREGRVPIYLRFEKK
jgi:tRNA (guanine-N7-)-methyltransferase